MLPSGGKGQIWRKPAAQLVTRERVTKDDRWGRRPSAGELHDVLGSGLGKALVRALLGFFIARIHPLGDVPQPFLLRGLLRRGSEWEEQTDCAQKIGSVRHRDSPSCKSELWASSPKEIPKPLPTALDA